MKKYIFFLPLGLLVFPIIALATGPFKLPFYQSTTINAYVDLDPRDDWVFDYAHPTPWDETVTGWTLGKAYDGHEGTDYNLDDGTQVAAAADGEVIAIDDDNSNTWNGGNCLTPLAGNKINVEHADDYETRYYHLKSDTLQYGVTDPVGGGTYIAQSGNTGCSSGDHLHFEVRDNGAFVDPYDEALFTTNPPEYFSTYRSQIDGTVESQARTGHQQTIGTGLNGETRRITFKVRSYHNGTGPTISASIGCTVNTNPGNVCHVSESPNSNWPEPSDKSVTLPNGNYSVTPYTGDATFEFDTTPTTLYPNRYYYMNVGGNSTILMGTSTNSGVDDPEIFGLNAPGGSSADHYFQLEFVQP